MTAAAMAMMIGFFNIHSPLINDLLTFYNEIGDAVVTFVTKYESQISQEATNLL
jgi:hypothetical protein